MRRPVLIVPLAFLLLAQCGSAVAATIHLDEPHSDLIYRAGNGERNDLRIRASRESFGNNEFVSFFIEDSVPIAAGNECSPAGGGPSSYFARCRLDLPSSDVRLRVSLGDRNDRVRVFADYPLETLLRGGSGNDRLIGGPGADIFGEGSAPNGSDTMRGKSGPGAAYLTDDRVRYAWRRHAVRADLAGDRDDGERGERDLIGADVEGITGGRGNDRLSGNDERNSLKGDRGTDVIAGLGGSDTIFAGGGGGDDDDTSDRLYGGAGSDELFGSAGDNVIDGGPAADLLYARRGRDRVRGRDGAVDQVICGKGSDTAENDPFDFLIRCEQTDAASESPAVPMSLNMWQDSRGVTRADVLIGCLARRPAQACGGTVQLELAGEPISPQVTFTSLSGHRQGVGLELDPAVQPTRANDVAVRVRSQTGAGDPTDDLFPATSLLVAFPFLN